MALVLTLQKQAAKVAHINLREEMHGDDPVIAIDIKLTFDSPNDFLTYLDPGLKRSLYGKDETQGELIADDNHLTHLRYPQFGELKWDGAMEGATVELHGQKKAEDIKIEADVNQVRLDCKDGGTVAVTLRVQTVPVDGQCGTIAALLGRELKFSVRPKEEVTGDANSDDS